MASGIVRALHNISASIQTKASAKSLVKLMHKQRASVLKHELSECVSVLGVHDE